MNLNETVVAIVEGHSGGIKFPELLFEVVVKIREGVVDDVTIEDSESVSFPDRLEKAIQEHTDLEILEYTWRSINRAKMFVYTP